MLENKTQRAMQLLLRLLQKSTEGGVSFDELCEEFEDSEHDGIERRIHRYIKDVKEAARPFGYELQTPGKGRRQGKYSLKPPDISEDNERELLLTILEMETKEKKRRQRRGATGKNGGMIYQQAMQFRRVEEYVRKMRERVIIRDKASYIDERPAKLLEECMAAVEKQNQLQIYYNSRFREVRPLGLVSVDDKWYLFTLDIACDEYRLFRVDKLGSLKKRDIVFEYPTDFSLREQFQNAWQMFFNSSNEAIVIKLRATGLAADEFELLQYHSSQSVERDEANALIVTMKLPSWQGMIGWILRWGEFVEVLEPADLRNAVSYVVGRMHEKYQ